MKQRLRIRCPLLIQRPQGQYLHLIELDGPPRMVGWITWSGRERSSQTQFLPVPGVWLIHPIYKSLFR